MSSVAATPAPAVTLGRVREAIEILGEVAAGLDASVLSFADAEDLVTLLAAGERYCQAAKTLAVGRVAEGTAFRRHGDRNAVDWLARQTRCSRREAAETVATADRLAAQPHLDQAMRAGDLNAQQATVVSAAAAADPSAEAELVARAGRDSLAGLRDHCTRVTAAARADDAARHERHRRQRDARSWFDGEGAHHLESANTGSAGVIIEAALKPFRELAFEAARAHGRRESWGALTADALEMLCADRIGATPTCILTHPTAEPASQAPHDLFAEHTTDTDNATDTEHATDTDNTTAIDNTTDADTNPDDRGPAGSVDLRARAATVIPWEPRHGGVRLPAGQRMRITVLIDHTALTRGHTEAGETCEIAGLGPVPVAAVHQLMATGDPFYAAVITRGTDVLNAVHLGRAPAALQRTALIARDRGRCIIAGCTNTITDFDHHHDHARRGPTTVPNLGLLCTAIHHPMKSRGGRLWWDHHGNAHLDPPPGWPDRGP